MPQASLAASGGTTYLVARDLSLTKFTFGVSKMAFAYVGVLMYPEIIVEMVEPRTASSGPRSAGSKNAPKPRPQTTRSGSEPGPVLL